MEQDLDKMKAKGIYLGGIGLLLMGVAGLIWCAIQIVSVTNQMRMMKEIYAPRRIYSAPVESTKSEKLPEIKEIVKDLEEASKRGTQEFYRVNSKTNSN